VLSGVLQIIVNLLTLGLVARRTQRKFERWGDITVWPFVRRADYETALRRPPYLNGPSNFGIQPTASGRG
jgi:hypothetical protein